MTIKISIEDTAVDEFSGISQKNGKPFTIRKQEGWVTLPGEKRQRPFVIQLDDDQPPYAPGDYLLDPSTYFINRFGALSLGRIKLVKQSAARAA